MGKYLFKVNSKDITRVSTGLFLVPLLFGLSRYLSKGWYHRLNWWCCSYVFNVKFVQVQNVLHPISKFLYKSNNKYPRRTALNVVPLSLTWNSSLLCLIWTCFYLLFDLQSSLKFWNQVSSFWKLVFLYVVVLHSLFSLTGTPSSQRVTITTLRSIRYGTTNRWIKTITRAWWHMWTLQSTRQTEGNLK